MNTRIIEKIEIGKTLGKNDILHLKYWKDEKGNLSNRGEFEIMENDSDLYLKQCGKRFDTIIVDSSMSKEVIAYEIYPMIATKRNHEPQN